PPRWTETGGSSIRLRSPPLLFLLRPQFHFPPRAVLDPDRRTNETEGLADLVFQKALVGKMQFHILVGEENKGRRSDLRLRHVEDANLLAIRDSSSLKIHALNEPVHLRRANALAALGCHDFE